MKRFLVALLLLVGLNSVAQNLYDIRWTAGETEYFGFMVFFSEEDVYMRTGYYAADGSYNVVHSEYQSWFQKHHGKRLASFRKKKRHSRQPLSFQLLSGSR